MNSSLQQSAGTTRNRPSPSICGWRHWLWRALFSAVLAGTPCLEAQNEIAPGLTNEVTQSEDATSADASQAAEALQEDDMNPTNSVAETNQPANAGPDARTRRMLRRAQNRSRGRGQTNGESRLAASATNAAPNSLDYSAFHLILDRNIFDPNRTPRSGRPPAAQPTTVDSFKLVGTMSYEKGVFAFFDGTSSGFKKVLKPDDTIAGYKIVSISPDSVNLMLNTNVTELRVGTQMRRREDGTWERSASSESYAAAASSSSSNEAPSSGADNDVVKRMMQRREKE